MLPNNSKILLYSKPIDMRKSINGLSILISEHLNTNPSNGDIYIFHNKAYDKLKLLYWDRNGFCLWYKRLEIEKFKIPLIKENRLISYEELRWLCDGLDINKLSGFKKINYKQFY